MRKIVENGKADFVVFRATVGDVKEDENLAQYIKDSANLKIGFFSANYFGSDIDAVAEAQFLIDTVEKYGFTPQSIDLPLFCDWEYFSYQYWKKYGVEITPVQLQEMTVTFCEHLKKAGYKVGVYLNKDYWDNWYGTDFFSQHPDYYIWYARPGVDTPDRDCYIWQYACNEGNEYGVDEPLDKNILMGEYIKVAENNETDVKIIELEAKLTATNKALAEEKIINSSLVAENNRLQDMVNKIRNILA
jgi:GH25 family lysozyme M1 (1,4-beta-N-acetylmuramidase)